MGIPSGVLFNNPLNVRPDGVSNWQGAVGIGHTAEAGDFLKFIDPIKGWRCAAGNVIAHYDRWQHDTIAKLIGGTGTPGTPNYRPGWAPKGDGKNDPAAYAAKVASLSGFDQNAALNFHTYEHLKPVLVAMATVEQGGDPYRWWNDQQIDAGLEQYGVKKPKGVLAKAAPAAGAAAATAAATGTAVTPAYPPPVPPVSTSAAPSIDPGVVIQHGQTFLQEYGYLFKWGAVALLVLVAAGLAWHWWQQHQKNKPGPAAAPVAS